MAERLEKRNIFSYDTEEPVVVSWAEISNENSEGWRQYYLAFGLGSGAIRCSQVRFDDGDWSAPHSEGISIAGGLEVSISPYMETWQLRHTMRTFWEPSEQFRALTLNDPGRLFGGNFARTTGNDRQYFTNTSDIWDYLAEQFAEHGISKHLPAVYYGINLSQVAQLSPKNQERMGPLAGNFSVPQGHISKLTAQEISAIQAENIRLIEAYSFIDKLRSFSGDSSSDEITNAAVNTLVQAARHRAMVDVAPGSAVLDTAGFAAFSDFKYDSKEVIDRQQTVATWQEALLRLHRGEVELF